MATTQSYFPRKSESAPMIYAYEDKYDPQLRGLLKVGYTTIGVQQRVRQQYRRCHHSAIRQTSSLCPWRQWQAMCLHTCGRRKYRSDAWTGNRTCSGKAIVRWRGKLQNVVSITICCGF